MFRQLMVVLSALAFIFAAGRVSFAQYKEDKPASLSQAVSGKAIDAGNKICPVSGEEIDEKMKSTYEYEGKIYNFCCPKCVEEFKKTPQKYIEKVEQEEKEDAEGYSSDKGTDKGSEMGMHGVEHSH